MKNQKMVLAFLALLLAALLAYTVAFAETTKATITFVEGELEFGDLNPESGVNSLDIDFGSHPMPVGPTVYAATDGFHTLTVLDARSFSKAGNWHVTAKLSSFTNLTETLTFDATITLRQPEATNGLSPANPLTLLSGDTEKTVVSAGDSLSNGTFLTTWEAKSTATPATGYVTLAIDAVAAAIISESVPFEATILWTLVDGF